MDKAPRARVAAVIQVFSGPLPLLSLPVPEEVAEEEMIMMLLVPLEVSEEAHQEAQEETDPPQRVAAEGLKLVLRGLSLVVRTYTDR